MYEFSHEMQRYVFRRKLANKIQSFHRRAALPPRVGQLALGLRGLLLDDLSDECCRAGADDSHFDSLANMVVTAWYDHRLVLLRAPHELLTATLAEPFNEYFKFLAFVFLVLLCRNLGLQLDELVQTAHLFLFRHVVWEMFCGIGAWPFGILEHESGIELSLSDQ